MFTHKIISQYLTDEGSVASTTGTYTGTIEKGYDGTVPPSTTDSPVAIAWVHATVQALELFSNQNLTVKTNSSTTPGQTINLVAGVMIAWGIDHLEPNPITADVTQLFLTNATLNPATVKIRILVT